MEIPSSPWLSGPFLCIWVRPNPKKDKCLRENTASEWILPPSKQCPLPSRFPQAAYPHRLPLTAAIPAWLVHVRIGHFIWLVRRAWPRDLGNIEHLYLQERGVRSFAISPPSASISLTTIPLPARRSKDCRTWMQPSDCRWQAAFCVQFRTGEGRFHSGMPSANDNDFVHLFTFYYFIIFYIFQALFLFYFKLQKHV